MPVRLRVNYNGFLYYFLSEFQINHLLCSTTSRHAVHDQLFAVYLDCGRGDPVEQGPDLLFLELVVGNADPAREVAKEHQDHKPPQEGVGGRLLHGLSG